MPARLRGTRRLLSAAAALAAAALVGCGQSSPGAPAPLSAEQATQTLSVLRGIDGNENGIRDEIEGATAQMAANGTERLRMLAFAWGMQQAMEVAMAGDEQAMVRASQALADAASCVVTNSSNGAIGAHVVELSQRTADSPVRQQAWRALERRTAALQARPSADPCSTADALAATIVAQTGQKMKARSERERVAREAASASSAPKEPVRPATSALQAADSQPSAAAKK